MTPDEEKTEILTKVLEALFPNPPFSIVTLAERILQGLGMVGWGLSYDPNYTQVHIQEVIEAARAVHPTPPPFVPPRPPERHIDPPRRQGYDAVHEEQVFQHKHGMDKI